MPRRCQPAPGTCGQAWDDTASASEGSHLPTDSSAPDSGESEEREIYRFGRGSPQSGAS